MNKLIYLTILLASNFIFAQRGADMTVYLDSMHNKTEVGNHSYSRVIKNFNIPKTTYLIEDYYKSGKIYAKGSISNIEHLVEEGQFTYYYENGNTKESVFYDKNIKVGEILTWYENGNKKLEGLYVKNPEHMSPRSAMKIVNYWSPDNVQTVIDGNGTYQDESNTEFEQGNIKDGNRDGVWTGKNKMLKFSFTESYDHAGLISGVSIDSLNIEHPYSAIEVRPNFAGGLKEFYKYVARNLVVPDVPGLKGKIFITFNINPNGIVSDVKLVRGIHRETDAEAIRVIQSSGPWTPGELRGTKVKIKYNIPISIQSSDR